MWYVMQVLSGEEEKTVTKCRKIIGLEECFIPYTKRQRKYCGVWHTEQRVLFPGYVFLVSEDAKELYLQLKQVPGLTRLLGTGREIVPLSESEEAFLRRMGGKEQVVEVSVGFIENEQIVITAGPLQGMEGCIRKIDRHKRLARLTVEMMGQKLEVQVGLEIVEKK